MTEIDIKSATIQLRAFAHPTRLAILEELSKGPKCVTDLEDLLPVRQANLSQHLALLRYTQLVDFAQDGQTRCYYLARPRLVLNLLAILARDEPQVTKTAEQINADKAKLAARKLNAKKPTKLKTRVTSSRR